MVCLCYAGTAAGKGDAARQELTDLESVLEDMYEKVEELQQVLKEHLSTKNALKVQFARRTKHLNALMVHFSCDTSACSVSSRCYCL